MTRLGQVLQTADELKADMRGLAGPMAVVQLVFHAAAAFQTPPAFLLRAPSAVSVSMSPSTGQLTRHEVLCSAGAFVIGAVAAPVHAIPLPGMMKNAPPAVKEISTPEQIALAEHLKATGATFYGAYWCTNYSIFTRLRACSHVCAWECVCAHPHI